MTNPVDSAPVDPAAFDPPPFDPAGHSLSGTIDKHRFFEDFRAGEAFLLPSRTITDAHFSAFQAVSGDNHPIHYDREYCRRHGHPDLLAHGLHVAALLTCRTLCPTPLDGFRRRSAAISTSPVPVVPRL